MKLTGVDVTAPLRWGRDSISRLLGPDDSQPAPVPWSLAKAALPIKHAAGPDTAVPAASARITGHRVSESKLAAYRRVVGSTAVVPIGFPQLLATALHLQLISDLSFPVRALGLVHPGFQVSVLAEVPADQPWDVRAWIAGQRAVRSGLEFDLCAELTVAGQPRWRSTAVTLARSAAAAGTQDSAAPRVDLPPDWSDEADIAVPSDIGRRFGVLSGDINLIHLHPLGARLFGFEAPIAHGWWLLGRIAAQLGRDDAVPGRVVDIAFRRPVPLPSAPRLRSAPRPGADGAVFALYLPGTDRPVVAGQIAN